MLRAGPALPFAAISWRQVTALKGTVSWKTDRLHAPMLGTTWAMHRSQVQGRFSQETSTPPPPPTPWPPAKKNAILPIDFQEVVTAPAKHRRITRNFSIHCSPLTNAYNYTILICMRTTLILKDDILSRASALTGVKEKTALVHLGLEALIARASAARLAKLGGTEKKIAPIPRRRSM